MRKYDLILVCLYILPVVVLVPCVYNLTRPSLEEVRKAESYFKELYRHPIKNVVIRETDMYIKVFEAAEKEVNDFKLTGYLSVDEVAGFRISGDTLFISNQGYSQTAVQLWVAAHVKVDTVNAPGVYISPGKVEENNNSYGF